MAQGYRLASLGSSDSGQALPFRARSESHGSRLGRSYPGSGAWAHGPRLGARLRPWLHATIFLPFAPRTRVKHYPTAQGSRFGARLRPWLYATCSPLRQIACVLPCYPRGKLKCGLTYAIFRFSKVAIFSAKYRTITPFFSS